MLGFFLTSFIRRVEARFGLVKGAIILTALLGAALLTANWLELQVEQQPRAAVQSPSSVLATANPEVVATTTTRDENELLEQDAPTMEEAGKIWTAWQESSKRWLDALNGPTRAGFLAVHDQVVARQAQELDRLRVLPRQVHHPTAAAILRAHVRGLAAELTAVKSVGQAVRDGDHMRAERALAQLREVACVHAREQETAFAKLPRDVMGKSELTLRAQVNTLQACDLPLPRP